MSSVLKHNIDKEKVQTINTFLAHVLNQPVTKYIGAVRYKDQLLEVRFNPTQGEGKGPLNRTIEILYPMGPAKTPGHLIGVYPVILGYTKSDLLAKTLKLSASLMIQGFTKMGQYLDVEKLNADSQPAEPGPIIPDDKTPDKTPDKTNDKN